MKLTVIGSGGHTFNCVATGWLLHTANPDFPDLVVTDKNELHVWGAVTCVVRKL